MVYMCSKKILCDQNDLDTWPTNIILGYCTPFDPMHAPCEWSMSQIRPEGEKDKDLIYNSAMTLTFDLKT